MSLSGAREIRFHACERKQRMGSDLARFVASKKNGVNRYRCPFCRAWHVGKVPSLRALHQIADALRVLAQQETA